MRPLPLLPTGHLVHHDRWSIGRLLVLVAVLEVAAAFGMSYVAGFVDVHQTLLDVSWWWLLVSVAALAVAFAGYYLAYRGIYGVDHGPRLNRR